jgi:hypothetical protein
MTTNTAAKGVVVQMGGRDIRFLPLNWQQLEDLQADLDRVGSMDNRKENAAFFTKDERESILRLAVASITRGNEGVDEAFVRENLDLSNVADVIRAIFNMNGFTDATPAAGSAGAKPGEAVAAGSGS